VAGGPFASRVLLELAHLFLEESPSTSEGEPDTEECSVGGESDDDVSSTGSITSELAHAKIASPSPLRRSGPPSITPIPITDIGSNRLTTSPSRSHTPPSTRTPPSTSPSRTSPIPYPSPVAKEAPQLSFSNLNALEVPSVKQAELGRTPSKIDQILQAYPSDVFTKSRSSLPSKPATTNSTPAGISVPLIIPSTPPTSPPGSPQIVPRFTEQISEPLKLTVPHHNNSPPSHRERDPSAYRLRRVDSFPRVSSLDEVPQENEEKDRKSEITRVGKLQRSMGALPLSTSPNSRTVDVTRRKSTDDFNSGTPPESAPIFTITELPTNPTPTDPKSPTSPSATQSPEEPDDSAWANFPRVYRGEEDSEHDGAMFHVTSRRLRSVSGLRKVGSQEGVRNKKYSAIVDMLINEAATCSVLKVSHEPSMDGIGMF
jgi:hypothetical protein